MNKEVTTILNLLKRESRPRDLKKLERYGINVENALGVPIPVLREIARSYKKQHKLALALWETDIHEARILASMIDDPKEVTRSQMNSWSNDFKSWDLCDQVCMNLFSKTPFVHEKIKEYSTAKGEFKKRAAFAMISSYTTHAKQAPEETILSFIPIIEKASDDNRNFVKKAVSWALRTIGKKNKSLNKSAIESAEKILKLDSPAANWIAKDVLREIVDHPAIKK